MASEGRRFELFPLGQRWKLLTSRRLRRLRIERPWLPAARRLSGRYVQQSLPFGKMQQRIRRLRRPRTPAPSAMYARLAPAQQFESSCDPRTEIDAASISETIRNPPPREVETAPIPESSPRRVLDVQLQRHLEQLLQFRFPTVLISSSLAANQLARRYNADAVTWRNTIYFRQGAFNPGTPKGLGLIAHEMTHIAWANGFRPSTDRGGPVNPAEAEEEMALLNERRLLGRTAPRKYMGRQLALLRSVPSQNATESGWRQTAPMQQMKSQVPTLDSMPAHRLAPVVPASLPPRREVKTALSSRDLTGSDVAGSPPEATLSDAQLRTLKDDVYRTLLDKLRSEFERGA